MYPTICNLVTTNNELLARVTNFSCYLNRNNGTPWIVPVLSVFFLIEIWMDVERSYFLRVKPARHYCLSQYCIPSSNREWRAINFPRGYKSTDISMWIWQQYKRRLKLYIRITFGILFRYHKEEKPLVTNKNYNFSLLIGEQLKYLYY